MRIAIDILVNPNAFSGFVAYVKDLLESLAKLDRRNKYFILTSTNNKEKISATIKLNDNFEYIIYDFPASWYLRGSWEQFVLPLFLKKKQIDVLYCPGNTIPIFSPSKTVVLIGTIGPFCKDIYADKNLNFYQELRYKLNLLMIGFQHSKKRYGIFESTYA